MIQVFCAQRGSGKTKKIIDLANGRLKDSKGESVFIDDDTKPMMFLKRGIRFISTNEFGINSYNQFYGLLCGMISSNYDIENIYIDGLSNIINCDIQESSIIFDKIKILSARYNLNIFININCDNQNDIPDIIREYVA